MSKFEALKKRIDEYITERVDRVFKQRLKTAIEEMLFPMAQAFIEETLNRRLEEMLKDAIDGALQELASEFEIDFEPVSDEDEGNETDDASGYISHSSPSGTFEPVTPRKVGVSAEAIKLMAFIHFYRQEYGKDTWPLPSRVFDHLGYGSVQLARLYSELEEEGWIKRTEGVRGSKGIDILRPLPNPSSYLSNPF